VQGIRVRRQLLEWIRFSQFTDLHAEHDRLRRISRGTD
jgi:hypothetical protein